MSMAPQAIHSNLSRPHPTDSRLLQNLIKAEKSYIDNLAGTSISGHGAASALAAWGTSEAPDIAQASQTLAEILASVADSQRTHVHAMEGYRSALKDVLDREQSIRSVVRDRDILVGRLIKASKKKVSKKESGFSQEEKMERVNAAQRELHACEQVLASEEAALVGVKRRTFKEALTMRMKTMGDSGSAMVEAAQEAILLLDEFDTHGPLIQATGGGQYESMYADDGVEHGVYDHQALETGYYARDGHARHLSQDQDYNQSHAAGNGTNLVRDDQGQFHKNVQQGQNADTRGQNHYDIASVTPSQSASQLANDRSNVPFNQRYTSQFENVQEQEGTPSDTDSEEDYRRAFIEPRSRLPAPHELGVASNTQELFIPQGQAKGKEVARNGDAAAPATPSKQEQFNVPMPAVPSAPVFDVHQARGDAGHPGSDAAGFASNYSPPRYSTARRSTGSEGGYSMQQKSNNSLLGKMSKLFKTDMRNQPASERPGWDTRGSASHDNESKKRMSLLRRKEPDSSDEEPDTRETFRNVNNPRGASSEVGSMKGRLSRTPSILPGPKSNKATQKEEAELERIRATVVGGGIANNAPPQNASGAASIMSNNTATKKKKKRPTAGSEIGTAPTRPTGSYTIAGDLSSLHKPEAEAPGLTRSSTSKSVSSKKKNRASLSGAGFGGGNVFTPNAGKFATDSWINKPVNQMTAYEAVAMAGVVPKPAPVPKDAPAKIAAPATLAPPSAPTSRPASVMSSADKNPPLKSALKSPSLSRANSTSSAKPPASPTKKSAASAASAATKSTLRNEITQTIKSEPVPSPKMVPIPKAPAPVTSTPLPPTVEPVTPQPVTQQPTQQPALASEQPPPQPLVESNTVAAPTAESLDKSFVSPPVDEGLPSTTPAVVSNAAEADADESIEQLSEPNQTRTQMPKLDIASSEPFSFDVNGVGQSNMTPGVLTPGTEQAYRAFIPTDKATPKAESAAVVEDEADRSLEAKHELPGTLDAPPPVSSSGHADPTLQSVAGAAVAVPAAAWSVAAGASPSTAVKDALGMDTTNKAASESGSALGGRKSVRMAPGVKSATETAAVPGAKTGHEPVAPPKSAMRATATPVTPVKSATDASASQQGSGWSSRIREGGDNDSSDEDDEYSSARKAFGSATRGWGEATGTIKPKAKKGADTGSVRSKKSTSKRASSALGGETGETKAKTAEPAAAPMPVISMYSATAPGSVSASGPVPASTMYQASAPASSIRAGNDGDAPTSAPVLESLKAPAPLTSSNLKANEQGRPHMPPVPQAPPAAGASTISVPTAPPPAISSPSKKGFFGRFKRNK